ncbi:hypothetical protein [Pseudomonas sp. NPDC089569]|uniref:hypothetical protein n=1 Tax=Pseudomonas sp. NPDC089569 TaxID=3390722 RepID=UPI003CFFF794
MSNNHPMGLSDLETRKLVRNVSAAVANSFYAWYMFEPHLTHYTGISTQDLQGAFMSAAVAIAKIAVKNYEICSRESNGPSFVATYCEQPFHFPRMPADFIGAPFLERVTHAEWAALGTALIVPSWLEQSIQEWAQAQGLKLKPQVAL